MSVGVNLSHTLSSWKKILPKEDCMQFLIQNIDVLLLLLVSTNQPCWHILSSINRNGNVDICTSDFLFKSSRFVSVILFDGNKVTEDKVCIRIFWNSSLFCCSFSCFWDRVRGAHIGLQDNWIKINRQMLFWNLTHDLKGTWLGNLII